MMDESEDVQNKLIDRVSDLDAARNRWFFGIFVALFLFSVVLGVYIAPVMELSTENTSRHTISQTGGYAEASLEAVAIPYMYAVEFHFELSKDYTDEDWKANIYVFKDELPPLDEDHWVEDFDSFNEYLRSHAFRYVVLKNDFKEITWEFNFRDSDTNTYSIFFYNPDVEETVIVDMTTHYEPLLPLVPIFFIIAFIIVLPLAIIRLYVIKQKKKELRVLLTLDLESLSDEDKLRLGIPILPKQSQPVEPQPPPMMPGQR
ncbi:MAG: hypothetical protein U9R75_12320 [Candidatus Thermoplasmatota archaeon]|nr:hypothetical protein [Candidatus Thermoplasmatota archaeon]